MSELPEKQVKRLKALLSEAETNLAAARELLTSLVGEDPALDQSQREEVAGKVIEGVLVQMARSIQYQPTMLVNQN